MMIKRNKRAAAQQETNADEPVVKAKNAKFTKVDKANKKAKFVGKDHGKTGSAGKFGKPMAAQTAAAAEKTDWNKFKQEKKQLKLKRKQAKDSYEISLEAKQIFEKLKCRRTADKPKLVEKLYNLLCATDVIKKIVMAHDMARVVQCMLKHATPEQQQKIAEKLLPMTVEMAVSKYSHFCVLRLLKYSSTSTKSKLVDTLFGHIVRLSCHSISSKILDHIYHNVASVVQKAQLRQEFYGDLYRKTKANQVQQLSDAYKDTPTLKASILSAVKSNLEHVANKNLVDSSLIHAVLLEYLHEIDEDKIEETVAAFTAHIPLLLSTKDGCQAAILCFYKSSSKNRRAIIKTIKEHLIKMCTHEHGHIFVIALLNALDDTKAIKKAIYDTLHPQLQILMSNQWGRRVMEWLISPGDTKCFHPGFIAYIEQGLQYGKKDKELRRKEIWEQIEAALANAIETQADFWLSNRQIGLITAEILCHLTAEHFDKAANALATVVTQTDWQITLESLAKNKQATGNQDVEEIIAANNKLKRQKKKQKEQQQEENATEQTTKGDEAEQTAQQTVAGIEDAGLHIVLKKIIKNDKERLAANADAVTFGSILVQQLSAETLAYWLTLNRACFVLLNVLEQNNEEVLQQLKKLLQPQQSLLQQQTFSGAQLLLKKLQF